MLNRKGQRLDLQEGWLTDQAVEIDAKRMCSQFGIETRAQPPEGMRMIHFTAGGSKGYQAKLNHRQRQTIHDTLPILGYIQTLKNDPPDQVEGLQQATPTPIETTLVWNNRKQVSMLLLMTDHLRFQVPAPALTNQRHRQQFAIGTLVCGSRSFEESSNFEPNIIDHNIHPGTKIVEVVYH